MSTAEGLECGLHRCQKSTPSCQNQGLSIVPERESSVAICSNVPHHSPLLICRRHVYKAGFPECRRRSHVRVDLPRLDRIALDDRRSERSGIFTAGLNSPSVSPRQLADWHALAYEIIQRLDKRVRSPSRSGVTGWYAIMRVCAVRPRRARCRWRSRSSRGCG
jgi:hypothetical protein